MNLQKIRDLLGAEVIVGKSLDREIAMVCACDLMSDVLSCIQVRYKSLLLTNLSHPQTVRTAEMAEIPVICFARGKKPDYQTIELAKKNSILLLSTEFSMYEASGLLYGKKVPGCSEYRNDG